MNRITKVLLAGALLMSVGIPASAKVFTASDNAWVQSGQGDQSEASVLTVSGSTRLAYLRFNIGGFSVRSNDLVYLDLFLTCHSTSNAEQLHVVALNDGTSGETTWNSSMTYATRPDGAGGIPNGNTTTVTTYDGRVMKQTAGTSGPRNQENPPGQISIVLSNSVFQALLTDDTNGELTLILYGPSAWTTVASLGSANLKPQLRVLQESRVETIPESLYGGQIHGSSWNDTATTAAVGEEPYNQILVFELPKRPTVGFEGKDTSLELSLSSHDINPGSWGLAMADIWAIGYVPANAVPLAKADLDGYLVQSDILTESGWNLGTNNTEKIYNNLTSPYSSPGRFAIPPDACARLAAFVNDLFDKHGAGPGDYLVLRVNPDVDADNTQEFKFNTGNAAANLMPVLTLSPIPAGTVIRLY